jgi:hypothetical protein
MLKAEENFDHWLKVYNSAYPGSENEKLALEKMKKMV